MLFGKQRTEKERNGFVNESIQIERLNYQVVVKKHSKYQVLTIPYESSWKGCHDGLYPKTYKLILISY